MFSSQLALLAQKRRHSLHLLLVLGIILYVYTPLLDHWLEREHYARPHTHIYGIEKLVIGEVEDHLSNHSEHEENVVCLLDIKTLMYVLLNVNIIFTVQDIPLVFSLPPYSVHAFTIYPPLLDPPPRIYA